MSTVKKRVFVCGIHQESNCFNPVLTPKEMFGILEGGKSQNALPKMLFPRALRRAV